MEASISGLSILLVVAHRTLKYITKQGSRDSSLTQIGFDAFSKIEECLISGPLYAETGIDHP